MGQRRGQDTCWRSCSWEVVGQEPDVGGLLLTTPHASWSGPLSGHLRQVCHGLADGGVSNVSPVPEGFTAHDTAVCEERQVQNTVVSRRAQRAPPHGRACARSPWCPTRTHGGGGLVSVMPPNIPCSLFALSLMCIPGDRPLAFQKCLNGFVTVAVSGTSILLSKYSFKKSTL